MKINGAFWSNVHVRERERDGGGGGEEEEEEEKEEEEKKEEEKIRRKIQADSYN